MRGKPQDITNRVYGGWLVLFEINQQLCCAQCICGDIKRVWRTNLMQNKTASCGCLRADKVRKARTTHGMSNTPTWLSWEAMHERCRNPKREGWKYYGGKGVYVCERWFTFENFLADMGPRPEGKELGRRSSKGPYCKDNCEWQTHTENMNNQDH